ncbi:cupredoxin domain-containing protein [Methylocystis heyeri]|nr:cupredoxin domain-containing protein [Methylocystis heyeri]
MQIAFAICIATSGAAAVEQGGSEVLIENFAFQPATLEAKVGERIVFVNRDQVPHSVVGFRNGEEAFRSAEYIDADDAYSVTLDRPGEIVIFCGLHGRMSAKIIVNQ